MPAQRSNESFSYWGPDHGSASPKGNSFRQAGQQPVYDQSRSGLPPARPLQASSQRAPVSPWRDRRGEFWTERQVALRTSTNCAEAVAAVTWCRWRGIDVIAVPTRANVRQALRVRPAIAGHIARPAEGVDMAEPVRAGERQAPTGAYSTIAGLLAFRSGCGHAATIRIADEIRAA